ncbi:MAG: VCBS repeat-containing protein [Planctomycetes bacterium]|nr:VCBS repeat-containing protein [Planctomycetota bacterium]
MSRLARTLPVLAAFALAASHVVASPPRVAVGDGDGETAASDDDEQLWRRYGFSGLIDSKFDDGMFALQRADVDGDGRGDLVVVNNDRARIELLVRRGDEDVAAEPTELVNELPDEAFFARESVAVEQKLWALASGDLDGDGRADLVFTGDSGHLVLAFAGARSQYLDTLEFDLDQGLANRETLALGDLDRDGRLDVAVLTGRGVQLFVQDELGVFEARDLLPVASSGANAFELADLDGDGFLDLVFVYEESEWPVRFRLGQPEVRFGPEVRSRHPEIRAHLIDDLDGDGAAEVLVIGRRSGRATVLRLQRDAGGARQEAPLSGPNVVPFPDVKDAAKRAPLLADVDRDGFVDLLVAEPGAARVVVHRGVAGGQFAGARAWPSLLGVSHPCVVDRDGDGLAELVIASPDESSVAVSRIDADGLVSFPETLGAPGGDLLALDVERPGGAVWALVAEGRGRSREYRLKRFADDGEPLVVEIPKPPADPGDMLLADFDRDGTLDVLLFVPTEPPTILMGGGEAGAFTAVDPATPGLGVLDDVPRARTWFGDLDGDGRPELLVPAGNFVRAVAFDEAGRPIVVAQVNLDDPQAVAGAVAAADIDGDGRREVLVTDRTSGALIVFALGDGPARATARIDLGGLSVDGLLVADLDGDGSDDVVPWSKDAAATLVAGAPSMRFVPVADYESPVEDAWLSAAAAGDVNGDGGTDLVFLETSKHLVHVAAFRGTSIVHALRFPVFEARLFESSRRGGREPREVVVGDVTGDGLSDVALLVHDRVLVYPQEPAP